MLSVDFRDILFILSKHYNNDSKDIFEERIRRRANRLREWIAKDKIIFIRHDAKRQTTDDDITEFWRILGVNNNVKGVTT